MISTNVYSETLFNFNFKDNLIENGFDNWSYVDKGSTSCGIYAGEKFSKLCSSDGLKFYPYYNYRNNEHMGWLRYGYIDSNDKLSITGSSLEVNLTGGAYKMASGVIGYSGSPIFSKSDLSESPEEDFGDLEQILLGAFSFYYKTENSTTPLPALQNKNRLSIWVLMPKVKESIDYYKKSSSLARPNQTFTMYPFINTSRQGHYYHSISNIPMGGWTKIQFDAHPQHHNSGSRNPYSAFSVGGYEYPGDGIAYFNNTTAISFVAGFSSKSTSPYTFYIDDIKTSLVLYENDETINNLGIGYDPQDKIFDVSFSDKYRCLECFAKYQIKYSFSPITLLNFEQAYTPEQTLNFNRNHNNNLGEIIKPNAGYNNLWAAIKLSQFHSKKLTDGVTIYFAIKDISNRSNIEQEQIDFKEQTIPNVGNIRTIDLIKTIAYPISIINYPLKIKTSQVEQAIKDHYYSSQIILSGGIAPYSFTNLSPLPIGLSLDKSGFITGTPEEEGDYTVKVLLQDHKGNQIINNIRMPIKSEEDFNIKKCSGIVNFGEKSSSDLILSSRFDTVISDKYTKNFKLGKTITIGKNGSYDFQGVTGIGLTLNAGDTIRAIWYNNSDIQVNFTPMISFNDFNRRFQNPVGDWYSMESITIKPNQYQVSNYDLPTELAGNTPLININVNYSNNKTLILNKIEYVSTNLTSSDICATPFFQNTNNRANREDHSKFSRL